MDQTEQGPQTVGECGPSQNILSKTGGETSISYSTNPATKIKTIGEALLCESLNLIEAQEKYHERSLHSTVSALQNHHGIRISREVEVLPSYNGRTFRCCRYWIAAEHREHAAKVLRRLK